MREKRYFKADLYGTSWYHSHYSAQYTGGLLGPMIIHGPTNYDYDVDLGPILLSDCGFEDFLTKIECIWLNIDQISTRRILTSSKQVSVPKVRQHLLR